MFTMPEWMATGDHASRPAASAVVDGALYSCTTHGLIYQSDGSAWTTWATLGGGAPAAHASSHQDGGADEIDVTGLTGASGGALVLLDTQTVTGSDGVITFSGISGAYNDLVIIGRIRDDAASNVVAQGLQMVVGNGSVDTTGTSYAWEAFDAAAAADTFAVDNSDGKALLARAVNGASATAGMYTSFHLEIFDYADVSVARGYICSYNVPNGSDTRSGMATGAWINTASAINIVTLQGASGGNLKVGSKARLYGRL